MNLIKITARVASKYIIAKLPPLQELKDTAIEMLEDVTDSDMRDLLQDIIESCEAGSSKAYLLVEDLSEMQDELAIEGRGVPHWDLVVEDLRSASTMTFV